MTKDQIIKARTLLSKAGINEDNKKDMVYSFTDGRTESLTAMEYEETQAILKHLEKLVGQEEKPNDKMKRKILSIAHEMFWHKPGTKKVDMQRVNNWCEATFKKPLDDLNYYELPKAVTAFERVLENYLKGI